MTNFLMRFSVRKALIFMLLIPAAGSLIIISVFYFYAYRTRDDVLFTNIAGRQRMVSVQFGDYVHMIYDMGQDEGRESLRKLVDTFDRSLAVMESGGEIMGRTLAPPPKKVRGDIYVLKQQWADLRQALLLIADQPVSAPEAIKVRDYIRENIPRLREQSDKIVSAFELLSHSQKERILWTLVVIFSLNFILLLTGIVVIIRYLNDRRQREETLKTTHRNYKDLVNSIEGIVWESDALTLQFSYVSKQAERLLGYPAESWISEPEFWKDHLHPDDRSRTIAYCTNLIEKKQSHELEYRMLTADGRTIWLRDIVHVVVENDKPVKLRGIMVDITERKLAEKQVEKLSEAVEQSADMVFITDPDGKIEYVNAAFEKITGYRKEEAVGQTPRILKSGKMKAEYYKNIWENIRAGKVMHTEVIDRKKNGELFIYEQIIFPLKDENNNIINLISTGKDITERVESRKKLEEALEHAKQADQVKTLFLANMSHEIRTPLNAILGFTDLIESCTRDLVGEEEKEFFEAVKNSGQRLMRTVHEILDISQIEAGSYELNLKVLNLVELVKDIVRECSLPARNKGLELTFQSITDSAFINADQQGISQAIGNIIDNAIKYTERGSVTISLKQTENSYVLKITDTGIGIAEKYLDKLFEAFTQESEGYTKKFQGIGLGLAIAKRHLDLNNVRIDTESIKGTGTTFTLTFIPVDNSNPEKLQEKKDAEIVSIKEPNEKPLILLVEDDINSQKLTGLFVRGVYDISYAASVIEAKYELKKQSPALILLDLSLLGDEDGLDLARYLRETREWRDIPIIALTAHAFTADKERCIAAGCNDYLTKPVKKETLLAKIGEFVQSG